MACDPAFWGKAGGHHAHSCDHRILPARGDDEPSFMAEMAVDAALQALAQAGRSAADVEARPLASRPPLT